MKRGVKKSGTALLGVMPGAITKVEITNDKQGVVVWYRNEKEGVSGCRAFTIKELWNQAQ